MAESMPKKTILVAVIGLLVLAGLGLAANFLIHRKTSDVHRGLTAPFITSSTSGKTTTRAKPPGKKGLKTRKHRNASLGPNWPFYGRSLDRTRNAADETAVRPPFRGVWSSRGGGSLEYPPTYANGVVYEAADSGYVAAYDLLSGKKLWFRKFHLTVLGSPALAERLLYLPCYDGRLYALDRRSGKTVWSHYIGGMLEGSPAVWRGKVFEGSLSGSMRAFDASSGRLLWSFASAGAVKHGPAIVGSRLYFGDYAGYVYCLKAKTGALIWRQHTSGLASGYRSGSFYSTPAVAYGRVYIGNTDGKVYSLVASNGGLAWTHTFPGWAYGSPAVSGGRVFATSWDGSVAALNARTGSVIWSRKLPYRTLASPVVIGNLVYIADRGPAGYSKGDVFAFDVRSGRPVWHFADGKYSSVITGGGHLIIAGHGRLYVLETKSAAAQRKAAKTRSRHRSSSNRRTVKSRSN
ncbi:MAG TPA: PQQ-binding-like beta-propeller repeat protein [Gaiellaceae bacterium]